MQENSGVAESAPAPERTELIRGLLRIKNLEERPRERREAPNKVILLGGGGVTGKRYGPIFADASMPVAAVVDIKPEEEAISLSALPQAEYHQLTPDFSANDIEAILKKFPDAALVDMTPQENHSNHLLRLGPMLARRGTPVWIDKPLVVSEQQARDVISLVDQYPTLGHQILSGGYALDKATPEMILLGSFGDDYPFIGSIKPTDEQTPDFKATYADSDEIRKNLGRLENVRFLFIEGRTDIREIIGKYGRTHLAFYPGGGMTGDMLDHLTDKLFRCGILSPDSELLSTYLGYTPIGGTAKTSFPWQVPKERGLAEIEGEHIMFGRDRVPVLLNYGKRGAEFLGDIRRSKLTFEHAVLETNYRTAEQGQSNIFTIRYEDGTIHSYFIDQDPYVLMLQRYKELWSGKLQGQGGLYAQLCTGILIEDLYRVWKEQEPHVFRQSEKAKKFRTHKHRASEDYQNRQDRDLEVIQKMSS